MRYIGNVGPAVLEGQVQARMKKTVYHVQIELDMDSHTIVNHNCSCPRGLDLCHHMAALLYYGHYNISSTDTERQWGVSGMVVTEEEPVLSIDQMFPQKQSYVAIGDPSKLNINKFKSMLGDSNVVGFSWLLKPEANEEMISLIPSIEDILYCQEYIEAEDEQSYVSRQCALNINQIRKIAAATVGQHSNELWLITHKLRLTSSKFGLILGAYKRNIETGRSFPKSLFTSLVEGYSLSKVMAVQWGRHNEGTATKQFEELHMLRVNQTSLWLDESGFLGASPDGLIGDDATLEVKCPYKMRNCTIREGVQDGKYFFFYNDDGQIVINTNHTYYLQVQGQLFLTNRDKCYFFVWTPNENECFIVEKDADWGENLNLLKKFYLDVFLPTISS
nr:unnamed protein product [Callosobruchus analis]